MLTASSFPRLPPRRRAPCPWPPAPHARPSLARQQGGLLQSRGPGPGVLQAPLTAAGSLQTWTGAGPARPGLRRQRRATKEPGGHRCSFCHQALSFLIEIFKVLQLKHCHEQEGPSDLLPRTKAMRRGSTHGVVSPSVPHGTAPRESTGRNRVPGWPASLSPPGEGPACVQPSEGTAGLPSARPALGRQF